MIRVNPQVLGSNPRGRTTGNRWVVPEARARVRGMDLKFIARQIHLEPSRNSPTLALLSRRCDSPWV